MTITHATPATYPDDGTDGLKSTDYNAAHNLGGESLVTAAQREALNAAGTTPDAPVALAPVDYLLSTLNGDTPPAATYDDAAGTLTETDPTDGVLSADGHAPTVGQRILWYYNNSSDGQNGVAHGIYVVTDPGNGTDTPWVLTRAADCDSIAKRCRYWGVGILSGTKFAAGSARVTVVDAGGGWFDASLAASGNYSTASGNGSTASSGGQVADAACQQNGSSGLGQHSRIALTCGTTEDVPATLSNSGSSSGFTFCDTDQVADYTRTAVIKGTVVARESDTPGTDSAWSFAGVIRGDGSTAYSWVGGSAPSPTVIAQDAGASTWAVAVTISGASIVVTVTGAIATGINWVCDLEVVEIASPGGLS